MNTLKVKVINAELAKTLSVKPGAVVPVECKNGVPVNREWRNRLKDSTLDQCVAVVPKTPPRKSDKSLTKEPK